MALELTDTEIEKWNLGRDRKVSTFLEGFTATGCAREAAVLATDAQEAGGRGDNGLRDELYVQAGGFASLAVMLHLVEGGELDLTREPSNL